MSQSDGTDPTVVDEPLGAVPRRSRDHHAGLWSGLVERTDDVVATVTAGHDDLRARDALLDFLRHEAFAHLQSEEQVLYAAARTVDAHALVAALELDHRFILDLVEQVQKARTALEAALAARALVTLVGLRIEKEDAVLIPTLRDAGVDVPGLLDGMVVAMATAYDSRFTYL